MHEIIMEATPELADKYTAMFGEGVGILNPSPASPAEIAEIRRASEARAIEDPTQTYERKIRELQSSKTSYGNISPSPGSLGGEVIDLRSGAVLTGGFEFTLSNREFRQVGTIVLAALRRHSNERLREMRSVYAPVGRGRNISPLRGLQGKVAEVESLLAESTSAEPLSPVRTNRTRGNKALRKVRGKKAGAKRGRPARSQSPREDADAESQSVE